MGASGTIGTCKKSSSPKLLVRFLKQFHRNIPRVTLYKTCLQNFDLSINIALVNGGFLHYMDMKKFLENFFLQNRLSDFEKNSQECSLGDPFQIVFAKF